MTFIFEINNSKIEDSIDLSKIPKSYQEFLKYSNGGFVPHDKNYNFAKFKGDEIGLMQFLPVDGSDDSIFYIYEEIMPEWYQEYEDDYRKYIPFARGPSDVGLYCFDQETENIYYLDLHESIKECIDEYGVLAFSFMNFLNKFIQANDGYIENLSEIFDKLKADGFE